MKKTIIFFVGKGGVGKTHLLTSLTDCGRSDYNYVNDDLVIVYGFVEKTERSIFDKIEQIYRREEFLGKNATFIFVMNCKPRFDYSNYKHDCNFKLLTMEDM